MSLFWIALLSVIAALYDYISITEADINYAGVCYGTSGNDIPEPPYAISLYQKIGIPRMRLLEYNEYAMQSLRGMGLEVTFGPKNEDLPGLASSYEAVESWFETKVEPYLDDFVISYIVVGNNAIPGPLAEHVLPVMVSLKKILKLKIHKPAFKVTTAVSTSVLAMGTTFPPSKAVFSTEAHNYMIGILQHLSEWTFPLIINVYPYDYYAAGIVRQEFATFTARDQPVFHFRDGKLGYWNMFDAMVDAFFWAMEKGGLTDVGLVVGETGWPSYGNGNLTTPELAKTYNQNFLDHIASKEGTPKRPFVLFEGFIYAMFDENLKPTNVEQHFGLFHTYKEPVYHLVLPLPRSHKQERKQEENYQIAQSKPPLGKGGGNEHEETQNDINIAAPPKHKQPGIGEPHDGDYKPSGGNEHEETQNGINLTVLPKYNQPDIGEPPNGDYKPKPPRVGGEGNEHEATQNDINLAALPKHNQLDRGEPRDGDYKRKSLSGGVQGNRHEETQNDINLVTSPRHNQPDIGEPPDSNYKPKPPPPE